MRDDVTCIIPCCGRLEHLQQMWPTVYTQMPCIVVAWNDPEVRKWLLGQDILCRSHKVTDLVGEPYFNLSRARNMGAAIATTPWLVFLDCDMLLDPVFAASLPLQNPNKLVVFEWGGCGFAGFLCVHIDAFRRVGGYNPRLEGYGYEDTDMRIRLHEANVGGSTIPNYLAKHIEHGDDQRTKNYRQNMQESHAHNINVAREMR